MTGGTRGHHNCGDPLMKSEPGSGFFDSCRILLSEHILGHGGKKSR
jgi:hypothetical protein